jgi:hypothetical protein
LVRGVDSEQVIIPRLSTDELATSST